MKKVVRLIAAGLLAALLAACGQTAATDSAVQTAAGSTAAAEAASAAAGEQTLVVYTALEDDQLERYTAAFSQAHPDITLDIVRDSTGVITAKLLAEKENPQADVIWGLAATSLLVADKQGMLEPYAPQGLDRVTSEFRDSAATPKWVGIDVWESAFCVNEIELKAKNLPLPRSWADLADPVYQGHIVMSNPASSGTGYLSVSNWIQTMGENEAWSYMDKLHQNIAQYVHSGSKPCRMAGAGEYPIGISFGYRAIIQKNDGEPITAVWPSEGSGWDVEANALVKKAAIKPAAKVFLDWAISDAIMKEYAQSFPITSVKTDQPIPEGYIGEPLKQLAKNDLYAAAENRERILAEWTKRYDSKSEPRPSQ